MCDVQVRDKAADSPNKHLFDYLEHSTNAKLIPDNSINSQIVPTFKQKKKKHLNFSLASREMPDGDLAFLLIINIQDFIIKTSEQVALHTKKLVEVCHHSLLFN